MTTTRKPAVRLGLIRPGDPITARYLNGLRDGVAEALAGVAPARSLRTRATDSQVNDIAQGSGGNERIFTEVESVRSTVRVFQDGDPTSGNFVDVEVYDQVTLQAGDETMTLVFNR